ncbi:ComEC/Rec2 family competence protein [Microlunatus ginsengisoli]|uniref:ComEC/Rec2 family competence protein n=1 Tax=Microlunatus ginsengisoli TaxID=363863 RepID=A0ABP6ZPE4_9ACTN
MSGPAEHRRRRGGSAGGPPGWAGEQKPPADPNPDHGAGPDHDHSWDPELGADPNVATRDERTDLRLVPIAAAAWAAAWCATAGHTGVTALAVAGGLVAALVAGLRRSLAWAGVAVVLLAVVGVGTLHQVRLGSGALADLAADRAAVSAVAVTTADPTVQAAGAIRPESITVRATVLAVEGRGGRWRVRGPVLLMISGDTTPRWRSSPVGTRWRVDGRLEPPDPGSGLAARLRVRHGEPMAGPGPGLRLVERVRAGLRAAVANRDPDARALVPALVLGDTSALPPDLVDAFKVAGLSHLVAVSGANLTLLLAFLLWLARWSGVRGWWLRAVGLVGVVVFVGLCRTEPSVLRAAAMGLVALAALGLGGGRAGLRHLSVAVLGLLLVDPYLARSYGFALSVLASAGIVWWAARWAHALRRWLPPVVAEAVAVPLAAQLATVPVVAQLSGTISVVGLLANAVAGPFVGPATVLGFAAAGTSLISPRLATLVGLGAAWSAQPITWIGRAGARLPGASVTWPTSALSIGLLVIAAVVLGGLLARVLVRRWLCLLVSVVLIGALLRPPSPPGWPPAGWVLVACDVGQGDGLVVGLGGGQALVVDAGPDPPAIRTCLDRLRVRSVPLLVLTHFHADHIGGLTGVLDHRRVGRIWVGPLAPPTAGAAAVRAVARDHGIPVETPRAGTAGRLGPAAWAVLGPLGGGGLAAGTADGGSGAESETENNSSLVLAVEVSGIRILLTGDVEPPGQAAMLAAGENVRADVLKVPHHGSARQDPGFLAAVHARLAVASAGRHNDYGHPAPKTVAALAALGTAVLRTDTAGSIAVVVRPDRSLVAVAAGETAATSGRRG